MNLVSLIIRIPSLDLETALTNIQPGLNNKIGVENSLLYCIIEYPIRTEYQFKLEVEKSLFDCHRSIHLGM